MAADREYELKFSIAAHDAERLMSHPLIRPSLPRRETGRLVSTYFDTPDSQLQQRRFGLRVRRAENSVVHTLKQSGGSLVDRGEWERADTAPQPNIVWLRKTPLAPLLEKDDIVGALGPRFTVDVTRTTFPLKHKSTEIEAALDQGTITTQGLSLPLNELELEVKSGRPEAVLDLARTLVRDLPLTLSLATKSERGYAVGNLTWGHPSEAITPSLTKRMTIAAAFEAIVQACLHTFLKNAALIGGGDLDDDVGEEAVHKSRIALRHLRAAFQLFKPALRRKPLARLRREIGWLSDRLGAARDADVFQTCFFEPAARQRDVAGAAELASLMGEHRRKAHRRLRRALATPRARLLFIDLLAFSSDGVRRKARAKRHRRFVHFEVRRRRRALARRARGIRHQTAAETHAVRKAAKMLRYDLDLFADAPKLGRGKAAESLGGTLKALQKSLGDIHDEEAMRAHLQATLLARRPRRKRRAPPSAERRQAMLAAAQLVSRPIERDAKLRHASKAARRL